MKLCKECKWSIEYGRWLECTNFYVCGMSAIILANAEIRGAFCIDERRPDKWWRKNKPCGIEGKLWEKKEESK